MKGWLRGERSWSDWLNPIVVKELRQATRGRFLVGILMLLLFLQLGNLIGHLVSGQLRAGSIRTGVSVAGVALTILGFVATFFVPIFAGIRLFRERSADGLDLLFITTLSPRQVVTGKLVSNVLILLLLTSACAPYLAFTYFLRGIDPGDVALIIVAILGLGFLLIQATILIASMPNRLRLLLSVLWLPILLMISMGSIRIFTAWVTRGSGSWHRMAPTLAGMSSLLVALSGLAFLITIALISPPTANRALPIRLYITVIWTLSFALVWLMGSFGEPWIQWWIACLSLCLLAAISTADRPGPRVAASIPRRPLGRAIAFLFYTTSGGGIAWALLLLAATLGAAWWQTERYGPILAFDLEAYVGYTAFLVAYAISAFLLHRRLLATRLPISQTWVVAALLLTALGVMPFLISVLFAENPDPDHSNVWLLLNPFSPFESSWRDLAINVGLAWAALSLILATPGLWRHAEHFRAPDPPPPEANAEPAQVEGLASGV